MLRRGPERPVISPRCLSLGWKRLPERGCPPALGFIPLAGEPDGLVIPEEHMARPAIAALIDAACGKVRKGASG